MPWMAVAGNVIGGLIGADAASSASRAQTEAAQKQADLQREMFNRGVELNAPFRQAGLTAQNRLMSFLGLQAPVDTSSPLSQMGTEQQRTALRNALIGQFTTPGKETSRWVGGADGGGYVTTRSPDVVNEQALNAAIAQQLGQLQSTLPQSQQAQISPEFGKYARDFSMSDFQQEPGYGFRLSEGLKALDRNAAARGGLLSGASLKAAQRYGQDLASQEYMNAFNRYQTNRANQLQPLQSLMGAGQTAANALQSAGQNYATGAGEAFAGMGNARAAGLVGGANAITGGLSRGLSAYRENELIKALQGQNPNYGSQSISFNPSKTSNFYGD